MTATRRRFLAALGALLAAGIPSCGDTPPSAPEDTDEPILPPARPFETRGDFVACAADAPFERVHWSGAGNLAEYLPPAAVGAKPGQTVADIGFGNGRHALILAQDVGASGRVLCRDIDDRAVRVLANAAPANMEVRRSDPGDVRIGDGLVDVLLLCDIFNLVYSGQRETCEAFLRSIHRALKPQGVVVVVYILVGVFTDKQRGAAFLRETDAMFDEQGFDRGRRFSFGGELETPLVFEYRRRDS